MDHHEQHHEHHRHEREEKKKHEKEEERAADAFGGGLPFHPLWFVVLGVVLILGVVLVWTFAI